MSAPDWVTTLPAVNAVLNGLATVLLVTGFVLIRRGNRQAHKTFMLTAFATSIIFLGCYLVYHFALKHYTGSSSKPFPGVGAIRSVYLVILATHVILAATVPVLASVTIYRGLKADWVRHRRIARITFPIWVYVSVTGVVIYFMVYHWPSADVSETDSTAATVQLLRPRAKTIIRPFKTFLAKDHRRCDADCC